MDEDHSHKDVLAESVETMNEAQILTSLLTVSERMAKITDIDELLQLIVKTTPQLINLNRCTIFLWDKETKEFVPRISYSPERTERRIQLAGFYSMRLQPQEIPELTHKLMSEKVPVIIKDAQGSSLLPERYLEFFKIKSMLLLPLLCNGDFLGTMSLDHIKNQHHFTPKEIRIAMGVATHAALAIKNAQLISRLKSEQERSKNIIGTMTEGLLVISSEAKVITTNSAMETITGLAANEIVGKMCKEIFEGGISREGYNYCEEDCPLMNTSERPCSIRIEGLIQAQKNNKKWISSNCSPALDIDGNILYVAVTIRDLTERQKMKEELSKLSMQLEENRLATERYKEFKRGGF
jgi:PAS domain S-box-containing protein